MMLLYKRTTKALIRLWECTDWTASLLFSNPSRQVFSRRPYIHRGDGLPLGMPGVNDLKFQTLFLFLFSYKLLVIGAGLTKYLQVRITNKEVPERTASSEAV